MGSRNLWRGAAKRQHDIQTTENMRAAVGVAFKALRKQRFIARQNFSCCGGCARYELCEPFNTKPGKYVGYAFYHRQDTAYLNEGKDLFIGFGAGPDAPDAAVVAAGEQIVAALRAAHLVVIWDGSRSTRIRVAGYEAPSAPQASAATLPATVVPPAPVRDEAALLAKMRAMPQASFDRLARDINLAATQARRVGGAK